MITLRGAIVEREYTQIIRPTERLGQCTPWEDATIYTIRGKEEGYVILGKKRGSEFPQRGDIIELSYGPIQPQEMTTGEERLLILLEGIEIIQKAPKNGLERLLEHIF